VTMIHDTVNSGDCVGTGEEGSKGLSGGLTVQVAGGIPTPLPIAPLPAIPEPETYALMLAGLAALRLVAGAQRRRGVMAG